MNDWSILVRGSDISFGLEDCPNPLKSIAHVSYPFLAYASIHEYFDTSKASAVGTLNGSKNRMISSDVYCFLVFILL